MTRPTRAGINCTTGEEYVVELTDEEIAELEVMQNAAKEREVLRQAEEERITALKTSARAKLVAGESLTKEEAATIVL
jgi:hypothetical protein